MARPWASLKLVRGLQRVKQPRGRVWLLRQAEQPMRAVKVRRSDQEPRSHW